MKIISGRCLYSGRFLALNELEYDRGDGKIRKWESVSRNTGCGAVLLICTVVETGELILIRQFRPPAGALTLEFPAGLIDPGETPEEAAVRELREETGFIGTVDAVYPPVFSSPGLTSEGIRLVLMHAAMQPPEERKTEFDESEDIETLTVSPAQLPELIDRCMRDGNAVDSKVLTYMAAAKALQR